MRCYLFIRYQVREYTNWREEFDKDTLWRQEQGEINYQIFRDDENDNMVSILMEWTSIDKAKSFLKHELLSEKMQHSGVMEQPTIYLFKKD